MLAALFLTAALAFAAQSAQDVPTSPTPDDIRERSASQKRESLFIGTQFFRPPNPRPEDLDRDLDRVKHTGLRMVRVWMFWSAVNPRPDVWEWGQYDRMFDLAEKHGLKVLLQHIPEVAPRWATEKFPAEPHACIDHSGAAAAREEFMRRAAERYRSRASLYGHDVWNEVSGGSGYCKPAAGRFQAWLLNRYKDIEALNRRYGTTYTNFSEVPGPAQREGEYAEQFDNADFHHALLAEEMRRRVRAVRMADPDHPVVSHWTGFSLMVWDADAWDFASSLDRWGTSSYIGHRGLTPSAIHELALQFNMTRDSAQGKPWWLAEHPSGTVWSGLGHALVSEAESRFRTILAFSFGAEASLYWQWRPEIHGGEASHFGLAGFDGELTPRTEDVRQICRMLERNKLVFDRLEWPRPRVGLVWDTRGLLTEQASSADSPDEKAVGTRNFEGFYSALLDQGYDVEVLNARLLAESGVSEGVRVVFVPFQPFEREGLSANLREWVKNGGTFFAGPLYGLFAPDTYLNKVVPVCSRRSVRSRARTDVLSAAGCHSGGREQRTVPRPGGARRPLLDRDLPIKWSREAGYVGR